MSSFPVNTNDKVMVIQCPQILDVEASQEFRNEGKSWMSSPSQTFVFDFELSKAITHEFYQVLIQFKNTLKKENMAIYSVNLSTELLRAIKSDGMEPIFSPIKSLESLKKQAALSLKKLDVDFLNPFLDATLKTLEVQANTKIKTLKPYIKMEKVPDVAIVGVISLITEGFCGGIVLCFSAPVFLKVYECLCGETHTKITNEIEDAVAELLNIIYGVAKTELNKKGYNFKTASPTVMTGEQLTIRQSGTAPAMIVPFEADFGKFHIEIEFGKTSGVADV